MRRRSTPSAATRFTHTDFTSSTDDGWLTISTGKATLKYKVGSGPFTSQNVALTVKAGSQDVTAAPAFAPSTFSCAEGQLCEAELAQLNGVTVATDHTGFTGTGFAAGFQADGNSLTYTLDVPTTGTYDLQVRYANSTGGDNQTTTRTLSATIDGGSPSTLTLPTTADWNTWALAKLSNLTLTAGKHTLVLARRAGDSGNVNVDSLAATASGGAYPVAAPATGTPCVFGTACEAEDGALAGGANLATDHGGFSGRGFVAGLENANAKDTISLANVPQDGSYTLHLRYANGGGSVRTISVNGTSQSLATTADWETWGSVDIPVILTKGDSSVVLACTSAADSCRVNLDSLSFTATGATAPIAHTSLGGYRRGLDGVNGSAPVTPGLLYKDGWSLLDDTPSALYDPATQKVTQRPSHGFEAYQDDYLFAYGHDYKGALGDLATLTGPSELLPRWAYGTWYSEYYDRTAAQYENTILPKFRADGVPLDVLVTDTDYKSPDVWDGWQIDTTKFPDPKGFFDWAQSEGLHNTMNIHPSILSTDPQYAQAQQTAQNKLTKNNASCFSDQGHGGDCYTFDWGDPNQLKAYFDLHQTMEQQGVDFWWLDWCCEQSSSSLMGVTPDAFINQQYANDANKTVGRGFAFSRAYGSLQAGGYSGPTGVPTGPWADKRTTVHFTGDTTSTWQTLAFEVGYTPGESASTGLSAVSHDIGGFNNDGTQVTGAEPGSTKEPDDLYARWVQLGTFQPIDRLHGNHSDRLPWQFGTAAKDFGREVHEPARAAGALHLHARGGGQPHRRARGARHLPRVPGRGGRLRRGRQGVLLRSRRARRAGHHTRHERDDERLVPPGQWTDYFTGKTYSGGSTQTVATTLDTMPVFIKAGAIMATRGGNVANDVQNPLTSVALDVASGANGHFDLFEDAGDNTDGASATTPIDYTESTPSNGAPTSTVKIGAQQGAYAGQIAQRTWTLKLHDVPATPEGVTVNGASTPSSYDAATRTLTVTTGSLSTSSATTIVVTAPQTSVTAPVGGSVPPTLSLTLGPAPTFGAFTPGVDRTYTTQTTANVISSAGDASLSATPAGHLANGAFSLPDALQVSLSKSSWNAPVSNDPVAVSFSQHIGANDALRTGSYATTVTFTLSTTNP